jgi:hypothetical protein
MVSRNGPVEIGRKSSLLLEKLLDVKIYSEVRDV